MAVENCRHLNWGDCKNTFCNARLPDNETTILNPPSGDPVAKKDVFWLTRLFRSITPSQAYNVGFMPGGGK